MAASHDRSQYGTTSLWMLKLALIEPFISTFMVGVAGAVVAVILAGSSGIRRDT